MKIYLHLLLCSIFFVSDIIWCQDGFHAERMKARLSKVLKAKDSGLIGEGVDGFLHLRKSTKSEILEMVSSENKDRSALFKELSKKTGGTIETIADQFAKGLASKSRKGHWFKKANGAWIQK